MFTEISMASAKAEVKEYMSSFGYVFLDEEERASDSLTLNFLRKDAPGYEKWAATQRSWSTLEDRIRERMRAKGIACSPYYWIMRDGQVTVTIF